MSFHRLVVPQAHRRLGNRPHVLAAAAAAVTLVACGQLTARAAEASPAVESGSGAAWAVLPEAATRTIPLRQPNPPDLAGQPLGAPHQPAVFGSKVGPLNASTGFNLNGNVTGTWGASGVRMTVDSISNNNASGTSGTLKLVLFASPAFPVFGNSINGYTLGSFVLGTLGAGSQFISVDTGFVAYTPPPDGCYYITVFLDEFVNGGYSYVDFRVFNTGGTPDGMGYVRFAFGAGSCTSGGGCVRDSQTACLVNGRFEVTVSFTSNSSSGPATVMAFNGQRAETDESVFMWFFAATNFEMGLKILPGCSVTGHFWVFISGLTDRGWTVTIHDTQSSNTAIYSNALGHLTSTTADLNSPLLCP